jgi:hypothetical protein
MDKTAFFEPETQAPEIYRNSPFEYVQTAEASQGLIAGARPLRPVGAWSARRGRVEITPPVPQWMSVAASTVVIKLDR